MNVEKGHQHSALSRSACCLKQVFALDLDGCPFVQILPDSEWRRAMPAYSLCVPVYTGIHPGMQGSPLLVPCTVLHQEVFELIVSVFTCRTPNKRHAVWVTQPMFPSAAQLIMVEVKSR